MPVTGYVYAFHRTRGVLSWYREVPTQMLILERFEEMPILLFTARMQKALNQGGVTQTVSTMSLDKRTGKLIYDRDSFANNVFHTLKLDRRTGTVDLLSHNLTLRHYLEGLGDASTSNTSPAGQPAGVPVGQPAPRKVARPGQVIQ
jgi:hypothetical protein